jgi:hypothetical protein
MGGATPNEVLDDGQQYFSIVIDPTHHVVARNFYFPTDTDEQNTQRNPADHWA